MASIKSVKMAIRRGEHGEARTHIHKILKSNPTAEAYYLAAHLEISPVKAIAHLEQALALEPDYQAALGLVQMLEYRKTFQTARLRQAVLAELETAEMMAAPQTGHLKGIGHLLHGDA